MLVESIEHLGYDIYNDLKTITHNFPFLNESLFCQLNNLVCVLTAIKIVSSIHYNIQIALPNIFRSKRTKRSAT